MVRDSSPAWLPKAVEESLGHPGLDHIDLYQVHWPDPETPFEETAEVKLTDEDLERIEQIMQGAVPVGGPTPEN